MSLEGALIWQTQNDVAIPGDTGTRFSLSEFDRSGTAGYRLYLGYRWSEDHSFRVLYAPLSLQLEGQLTQAVNFSGETFQTGVATTARYKFNSYRLTYAYRLPDWGALTWAVGFTAKIRDAEISLSQGGVSRSKTNVGFVPLLHFQALYALTDSWGVRLDFDGLAARQGRAIDLGLFLERSLFGLSSDEGGASVFLGYRTVEGGADNSEVYNFAWFHAATVGLRGQF
jgi:hypothetical protein